MRKLRAYFEDPGGYADGANSYTWANEVCAGDNEERALVISSMNGMQYAFDAWIPIVIFPQTMAPDFRGFSQFRNA